MHGRLGRLLTSRAPPPLPTAAPRSTAATDGSHGVQVAEHGLKVQAVMSFHAAGGNVGDTCKIPLPKWVLHVGEGNPDIFYTDRKRVRNKEYISLGCDDLPLFWGRTPVQMYCDFTSAFVDAFSSMFGAPGLGGLCVSFGRCPCPLCQGNC